MHKSLWDGLLQDVIPPGLDCKLESLPGYKLCGRTDGVEFLRFDHMACVGVLPFSLCRKPSLCPEKTQEALQRGPTVKKTPPLASAGISSQQPWQYEPQPQQAFGLSGDLRRLQLRPRFVITDVVLKDPESESSSQASPTLAVQGNPNIINSC